MTGNGTPHRLTHAFRSCRTRGRVCGPWASIYMVALVAALPLAFAFNWLGIEPALAASPAMLIAVVRLITLVLREPRHLRGLFATPWARAYSAAFAVMVPLAFALGMVGLEPALAASPGLAVAGLRLVILMWHEPRPCRGSVRHAPGREPAAPRSLLWPRLHSPFSMIGGSSRPWRQCRRPHSRAPDPDSPPARMLSMISTVDPRRTRSEADCGLRHAGVGTSLAKCGPVSRTAILNSRCQTKRAANTRGVREARIR